MHPGRQKSICDRSQNHAFPILSRSGIKVVDFWLDDEGAERLYYVCKFESVAAKERAWASFRADPEWARVKSGKRGVGADCAVG
jgi:hypothetical protein